MSSPRKRGSCRGDTTKRRRKPGSRRKRRKAASLIASWYSGCSRSRFAFASMTQCSQARPVFSHPACHKLPVIASEAKQSTVPLPPACRLGNAPSAPPRVLEALAARPVLGTRRRTVSRRDGLLRYARNDGERALRRGDNSNVLVGHARTAFSPLSQRSYLA